MRLLIQILLLAACLIPTWIFLIVRALLDPGAEGFWAEVVVTGLGLYFLGGVQLVGIVILIAVSVALWTDEI